MKQMRLCIRKKIKRRPLENKEVLLIRTVRYINYINQSFCHIIMGIGSVIGQIRKTTT